MDQLAKIPTKSKKRQKLSPSPSTTHSDIDHIHDEEMDNISHEFTLPHVPPELADTIAPFPAVDPPVDNRRGAWVEDAEDNDNQPTSSQNRYSEAYPHSAGQPLRKEKTEFEKFCNNDSAATRQPWEPFSSKKEWELATWLIKNANQKATEQYLKLPIVSVQRSARYVPTHKIYILGQGWRPLIP